MTSLIFRRDIENPYFSKHDSQLYYPSHKLDTFVSKAVPSSKSQLASPYLHLSNENSPLRSQSNKHKSSLPYLFTDYDLQKAASNKPKPPAIDMPISTLYAEESHQPTKSGSVPYLYWKNLDTSNTTASTYRAPEPSQKIQVPPKMASARLKTNASPFDDDPFAHKKLFGYLEFLEKTNKPFLKENFNKKAKKGASVSTKTDVNTSNELKSYSIPKASESIRVVTKEILTPKTSKKSAGTSVVSTKLNISPIKKTVAEPRRDSIELSLAPKDRLPEPTSSKTKTLTHKRIQTIPKLHHSNQEQLLFKALAHNLNELYNIYGYEKKVHSVIEQLTDNNEKVVQLISSKAHKVSDYDIKKLTERFTLIEFSSEHVSIPEKLEKNRLGIITVEPSLLKELQNFNEKVEEYVIDKKRSQLKQIEDGLIQTEENLQEILLKKTKDMSSKHRIKQFQEAKALIEDRPKVGMYFLTSDDPVTVVEGHQKAHGDLKYVKIKNLEHARGLKEVFSTWRKHTDI